MHIAKSQINDQIVIAIDNECTKYIKKKISLQLLHSILLASFYKLFCETSSPASGKQVYNNLPDHKHRTTF